MPSAPSPAVLYTRNEVEVVFWFPRYHTNRFYKRIIYTLSQRAKQPLLKCATQLTGSLVIAAVDSAKEKKERKNNYVSRQLDGEV